MRHVRGGEYTKNVYAEYLYVVILWKFHGAGSAVYGFMDNFVDNLDISSFILLDFQRFNVDNVDNFMHERHFVRTESFFIFC